jgi:hypothetical protein
VSYHAGELRITTMCAGLAVTTKTGDLGKVEVELVLEPVHGVARTASKDLDEVVTSKLTSLCAHACKYIV